MRQTLEELESKIMISIKIDQTKITKELRNKADGMLEFSSPRAQEAISKAVFTVVANDFIRKTNVRALAAQKAFHHIYEWDHIGQSKYKLFTINRAGITGGNLKFSYSFLPSKSPVPIPTRLKKPNKRGRFVNKQFIFKNKAEIMEVGNPTRPFSARGKALVFLDKNKNPVFVRKPDTVSIIRPGGRYTKGAFNNHFIKWFSNPSNINAAINKSGMLKSIETDMARALNRTGAGRAEALRAIQDATAKYSKGVVKL